MKRDRVGRKQSDPIKQIEEYAAMKQPTFRSAERDDSLDSPGSNHRRPVRMNSETLPLSSEKKKSGFVARLKNASARSRDKLGSREKLQPHHRILEPLPVPKKKLTASSAQLALAMPYKLPVDNEAQILLRTRKPKKSNIEPLPALIKAIAEPLPAHGKGKKSKMKKLKGSNSLAEIVSYYEMVRLRGKQVKSKDFI